MAAFEFITPGRPFFEQIAPLRAAMAAEPVSANSSDRSLIRIELGSAEPRLKWAYVSRQIGGRERTDFSATTLLLRAKRNRLDRYEFPRDPKLDRLGSIIKKFPPGWEVLRYVPRRRLTIKTDNRVAKFVRSGDFRDVISRLRSVEAAVKDESGFSITEILECDFENSVFFQKYAAGKPFTELVNSSNMLSMCNAAGRVLHRIHCQRAEGLPSTGIHELAGAARKDQAMLALFRPDLKDWLNAVMKAFFKKTPPNAKLAFCHGDFRAPHLLIDQTGHSHVIDFDGAAKANPEWEQALFVTSLKRELSMFSDQALHDQAVDAFLKGYEAGGGNVNRHHFEWFRLGAEIHFLARTFQRDLYTPTLFSQTVSAIAKLSEVGTP